MGSCVFVRCPAGPCGVQPAERVLSAGGADALFCSMPALASPKESLIGRCDRRPPATRALINLLLAQDTPTLLVGRELESWGHRRLIIELAEKNRRKFTRTASRSKPVVSCPSRSTQWRWTRPARYIAQILNGASPGDILSIRQRSSRCLLA